MEPTINIDYIACVSKLENGTLQYKEFAVKKPNKPIMLQLKDMVDNPNRTLLDIQEVASALVITGEEHNVCIPYSYSASYISSPKRPDNISFYAYQNLVDNKREELELQKKQKEEKGEDFSVEEHLQKYLHSLKLKYFYALNNYVNADEYAVQLALIQQEPKYLMYSTEKIGWTIFNYPISENVKFEVKTNFGYGSAAYFYVNLIYKGIKIIPYSDLVKYYYANMRQYGQYTRQYRPRHMSWPVSLNFVVDTANLAHTDSDEFVKVWIKNELDEMMKGLRLLKADPDKVISAFVRNQTRDTEVYLAIRNIQGDDLRDYKAFPKEMKVAYKAYKISGALHLLENMCQLSQIYDFVYESIAELKEINRSIIPEIEATMSNIAKTIKRLKQELTGLTDKLAKVESELNPLYEALAILSEGKVGDENTEVMIKFNKDHPNFINLQNTRRNLKLKIQDKNFFIAKRKNFYQSLTESLNLINENTNS